MPFATTAGRAIFFTDDAQNEGSSSQTTTVFIHGLGSSSCFYKTITPYLQSVTRCIAVDTPGSGLSELGQSAQSVKSISSDVIGLLDYLKIEGEVVIVGHSMGGIVASEIAASYPERVRGVVLIGPVNPQPQLATVFEQRIEAVKKGRKFSSPLLDVPLCSGHMLSVLCRWFRSARWDDPHRSHRKGIYILTSRLHPKSDSRNFILRIYISLPGYLNRTAT